MAAVGAGPVGFGYKIAWLAIRTDDTRRAAEALRLSDVRAASWAEGIDAAYAAYGASGGRPLAFVTPVVDDWTLAVLGGGELRKRSGYVAAWEHDGARRAAQRAAESRDG